MILKMIYRKLPGLPTAWYPTSHRHNLRQRRKAFFAEIARRALWDACAVPVESLGRGATDIEIDQEAHQDAVDFLFSDDRARDRYWVLHNTNLSIHTLRRIYFKVTDGTGEDH